MKAIGVAFLAATLCATGQAAATAEADAAALLEKSGVRGGLALVIGAKDMDLAAALARASALYVQVLQPDARLAAAWGAAAAAAPYREKLGVRAAAFGPDHYDSNLFNLVVVADASALGAAGPAGVHRILVPGGVLAFRDAADRLAGEAKALGMTALAADPFGFAARKAAPPIAWTLPLALKWRAGARSQIARGYSGICAGAGNLYYIEQMERDSGNLKNCSAVLFARDAWNGRTLWARDLPGGYPRQNAVAAVSTSAGRLFVKTATGKIHCLDGRTGEALFEVPVKANWETRLRLLNDDLLSVHGDVRSTETGKPVWRFPRYRYQPLPGAVIGDNIYFCDTKAIFAKRLADGSGLWRIPVSDLPRPVGTRSLGRAGSQLLVRMAGKAKNEAAFALLDSATGKRLWTYTWKIRISKNERYFNAGKVRFTTVDGKILLYYRHNRPDRYADEVVATRLDPVTGKPDFEDKTNQHAGDFHGCFSEQHLGNYIAWYDVWVDKRTLETARGRVPHPACFFGSKSAYGLIFNFPSRKSGPITAVTPADAAFEKAPGGATLVKAGAPSATDPTDAGDWPMFRGAPAGGNACNEALGTALTKAWEAPVGLGRTSFGVMSSQRTGLTQAVVAYGLAVVADIDGQRIVALNVADGKQKWAFHVGSRVDYPPTLHKGLCLVAARDGWVYALDAATGGLVWKLLAAPRERFMGGWEKLESHWPLTSDVLVVGGVAYVSGGAGGLAFKPETGEVVEAKDPGAIALGRKSVPGGRDLTISHDVVIKGNSIPRTNEDNWPGFRRLRFGRRLDARVMAFDGAFTAAYQFRPAGEGWANRGTLLLKGIAADPKKPVWTSDPIQLVTDDLVLTPRYVYCVGHYQRVKKAPELWVVSRESGEIVSRTPVGGFPAFLGMSAAHGRLFVATREGKLICFTGT